MHQESVALVENLTGFLCNLSIRREEHGNRTQQVRIADHGTKVIVELYGKWADEHLTVDVVS